MRKATEGRDLLDVVISLKLKVTTYVDRPAPELYSSEILHFTKELIKCGLYSVNKKVTYNN